MKTIEEIITVLKANHGLFDKYGAKLIGVFGSYVRNEANEKSDIDILINADIEKNILREVVRV